jgi:hypothetical protein
VGAELVRGCLQACGAPASYFDGLAASLQEGEEGNQRGGGGLLIGTGAGLNYSGNKGIEGRGNSGRRFPVRRRRGLRGRRS